jgi:hypothetical protein
MSGLMLKCASSDPRNLVQGHNTDFIFFTCVDVTEEFPVPGDQDVYLFMIGELKQNDRSQK